MKYKIYPFMILTLICGISITNDIFVDHCDIALNQAVTDLTRNSPSRLSGR